MGFLQKGADTVYIAFFFFYQKARMDVPNLPSFSNCTKVLCIECGSIQVMHSCKLNFEGFDHTKLAFLLAEKAIYSPLKKTLPLHYSGCSPFLLFSLKKKCKVLWKLKQSG